MSARYKKILIWILKLLIFVVAWGYVVYKFETMDGDVSVIFSDRHFSFPIFVIVCLLMFANWGLESLKWQKLICCTLPISYKKAVSGVLVGLPLALITPNRIGEIGGRAIVLERNRKEAVFATFLGSLMQLSTTLIMGLVGILLYLLFLPHNQQIEELVWISVGCVLFLLGFVFWCRDKRFLKVFLLRMLGKKFFMSLLRLVRMYSGKDMWRTLFISILRYVVFSTQFALLIKMLIPELSLLEVFVGISLMYLFTTLIPTSVLGEVGIRGSVAIAIFQFYTAEVSIIFQISIVIWFINIVVPTLAGSLVLLSIRRKRSEQKKASY